MFSCHGLDIVTAEGIGDKQDGYHQTQKVLAQFNGSQCGYCSPGMVMNMYSLLESKKGKVTMAEVENAFGGNICRCTGYRPILDAFKSLAVDAEPRLKDACQDIEDLTKICPKTGNACAGKCSALDVSNKQRNLSMVFSGNKEWYKVQTIEDLLSIFQKIGSKPYMLVAGNTAHGESIFLKFLSLCLKIIKRSRCLSETRGFRGFRRYNIYPRTSLTHSRRQSQYWS